MPAYTIRNEHDRQQVADTLSAVDPTLGWRVTVEKLKKVRTIPQNRLYHDWIGIIATEMGDSHEDVHDYMRKMFLPPVIKTVGGETFEILQSTTKLEVPEMSEYMNKVEAWAGSFLGLSLPHPEDMHAR
jgi:hypothetical protein